MKNIWAHSMLTVALGSIALCVAQLSAWPLIRILSLSFPDHATAHSVLGPAIFALSKVIPGLAAGWFTRRHPLLVGGAIGLIGTSLFIFTNSSTFEVASRAGILLESAIILSVSTLAGRALKIRYSPSN